VTLGPKSKSVLIGKSWGSPIVCNDGVTIAKKFDLKDPEENLGSQVIRQAAERTGDTVGDGTTSTILAHAIFADGLRNVAAGASAIDIRRGIERGLHVKEKLQERLAKLVGGVAVVMVGAPSEAELKSKKEAFEDAISATKAAVAEGIVPGAGLTLLRAADRLVEEEGRCDGDERSGVRILRRALEAPVRQIAANSGVDGGVVVERMRSGKGSYGFDAARGTYVDLVEAGIIDPTKVVRIALENAVSVAGVLLLTEATLTDIPEPQGKTERSAPME
jgi:chaperonin GroEL (HSP60 family)